MKPEPPPAQSSRVPDDLQAYYAARAPEYDRVYAKPERQQDLRAIERWIAPMFAGKSVLEVACGTGYWTQFLAPVAKAVVAVDASPETLQIAKSRVSAAHVQFTVGDAYRLPFGDASFDGGFAGFWISHVPRARVGEFLRGFHRALKPGAKTVLLDNRFVAGSSTTIAEQDSEGNTYQLRPLEDGSMHRVLKNFPSEAELRRDLAEVASEVCFHEWRYYWAVEYAVAAITVPRPDTAP
jgi:ubiquinone/menaquinone biosynthesis C-methylase UbiE